jgi:hypothetical protein
MKIGKQQLQVATAVAVMAVGWSLFTLSRGTARAPQQQDNVVNDKRPPMGRGMMPSSPPLGETVNPASIQPPPSVDGAPAAISTRDPFLFGRESREVREALVVAADPVALPDPIVRSIMVTPSRKFAMIENRVVKIGDTVGDFKVVQIERDAVTFLSATGERRRISIKASMSPGILR